MASYAVTAQHLSKRLERGAVTGFVGSNGAGKTITIRMPLGLIAQIGSPAPERMHSG